MKLQTAESTIHSVLIYARCRFPRGGFVNVLKPLTISALVLLFAACGKENPPPADEGAIAFQKELQRQLITAQPGDVITIPAGVHPINRGLSLNVSGVTLRGEGMDESILSFKGQVQGAEGLLVNASDFTIEDLAIEDTAGDGLKVNEGRNIVIRRVRTEWTNGHSDVPGERSISQNGEVPEDRVAHERSSISREACV